MAGDLFSDESLKRAADEVKGLAVQFIEIEQYRDGPVIANDPASERIMERAIEKLQAMGYHAGDAKQLFCDVVGEVAHRQQAGPSL